MNYNEIFANYILVESGNECNFSKDCKELADFSKAIKDKGLSSKEYALAIGLFVFILREKRHVEAFGNTRESVVKYALDNFQVDWLANRWNSIIEDKEKLKSVIAVLPQYVKDMIINIVDTQSLINHNVAEHLIKTSEEESIEISKMLNPAPNKSDENKLKDFTENELIEELKRREIGTK